MDPMMRDMENLLKSQLLRYLVSVARRACISKLILAFLVVSAGLSSLYIDYNNTTKNSYFYL